MMIELHRPLAVSIHVFYTYAQSSYESNIADVHEHCTCIYINICNNADVNILTVITDM